MPLEQRAKIFVPFDPLEGFSDALRAVELQLEEERREKKAAWHEELDEEGTVRRIAVGLGGQGPSRPDGAAGGASGPHEIRDD